jgi:hypothetical protein
VVIRCLLFTLACLACGSPAIPDDSAFTTCGNGICELGEAALVCPTDCGPCAGSPNCDDGEACTQDSCHVLEGCQHLALSAAPCDADPCTEGGQCLGGKCVGRNKLWSLALSAQPGGNDIATGVAQDGNGDLIAVGNAMRGVGNNDNFMVRLPTTGTDAAHLGTPEWLEEDAGHDDLLMGVAPLNGGGFLAVGERRSQYTVMQPQVQTWARWIWIKPESDTPEPHHMSISGNHGLAGVARAGDGSLLAVGHVDNTALLARFNADATPGWKIALGPAMPGASELLDVAAVPVQQPVWVAAGWTLPQGQALQRGWAVQLAGPATEVAWNVTLTPPDGLPGIMQRIVALPDGGAVAIGTAGDTPFAGVPAESGGRMWWVRLSPQGDVVWQKLTGLGWGIQSLVRVPGEDLLLASVSVYPSHGLRLAARALDGTDLGLSAERPGYAAGMLVLADGTLFSAGAIGVAGQNDTWLARTDRWGARTCALSGTCFGQIAMHCDDGNPCTADDCGGATKCEHPAMPDGVQCAAGLTCSGGQCVTPIP